MSKNKKISACMSAENKQMVLHNLTSLEGALQNAILCKPTVVSPVSFARMNCRNIAFVNKALTYAVKTPVLVPPYLHVISARKNFQLAADLASIHSRLSHLVSGIKNTINAANADAYETAIVYYKIIKGSGLDGNEGIDLIINDLENLSIIQSE